LLWLNESARKVLIAGEFEPIPTELRSAAVKKLAGL